MAGLVPVHQARAQELGRATAQACTREFRTLLLPVRDARGRPLGRLRVSVRRARTRQLVHAYVSDAYVSDASAAPAESPPGESEIPSESIPRGPARPHPYEEHEVPGAPGTPAGTPAGTPPTPLPRPAQPPAPRQPAPTPSRAAVRQIRLVDDGMLGRLKARGDTLVVDVRSGPRAGRATVVVAADGPGACHVVLVRAPAAVVLR